jgi:hypothetical protein
VGKSLREAELLAKCAEAQERSAALDIYSNSLLARSEALRVQARRSVQRAQFAALIADFSFLLARSSGKLPGAD